MAEAGAKTAAGADAFLHRPLPIEKSRFAFAAWALTNPLHSRLGGRAVRNAVDDAVPPVWADDLAGKRVLVVGSGPSLDRVDNAFFAAFDTALYINFALLRRREDIRNYFFTTDLGPVREMLDLQGPTIFRELGRERCLYAPIFLDQWRMLTPEGHALFTALRPDAAHWRAQWIKVIGDRRLPLVLRYRPVQPDWEAFRLPRGGRTLPVIDHTSALTATLFAATQGAAEVGLIGCDFSTGRASGIAGHQADPGINLQGAAGVFRQLTPALARQGVDVVNHSWLV